MNPRRRPLQALSVIVLTLTALLLAARALAPTAAPRPAPAVDDMTANLLSGTVTGLDPGDGVRLQLERLAEADVNGHGEIVDSFDIVNGPWQQQGLALLPGHYRLVPEAKGYVHVPRSIVIQVPEEGFVWRYTDLDFEFLHPEDARSRLGLPLCPELPSPVVAVTVVPQGTPGHTPQPESMPPDAPVPSSGMCYGNHLADVRLVPAGLQGRISGLPDGQTATITLYELSPLPDEQYGQGEPPSPDSSWTYPPEVARLEETPAITPDWSLTATLVAENGRWGLADPSLAGKKYLAVASAPDQIVDPPAYEVVIFAGKALGFPGDVDFAFGPSPVAHPIPAASADELAELVQGNTAFAFDLYQILRSERDGNFLYSPYSVSLALAMAYAGARGETERQMANTLHFSLPQERLHPSLHTLGQEMSRHGTNGQGFWMNVANALWGQENIRFLPEFIDLLAVSYGAEMRHLDFAREEQARKEINDWVGQQTEGRIKELLPPGVLDGTTRLLLINAVYFNAAWARQFDPRHTEYGVFHLLNGGSVMAKMMHQAEQFAYTEGLDYQAVELPYEDSVDPNSCE